MIRFALYLFAGITSCLLIDPKADSLPNPTWNALDTALKDLGYKLPDDRSTNALYPNNNGTSPCAKTVSVP